MRKTILLQMILLLAASAVASAQAHKLKLSRPMKVGEEFSLTSWYEHLQRMTVSRSGQALLNQDSVVKIYLLADGEVIRSGDTSEVRYEIFQFLRFEGGDTVELAPPGTRFVRISDAGGNETITGIEGTLAENAAEGLMEILSDAGRDADENFGTDKRQLVGNSWPINTKKAAESLSKGGGLKLSAENVKGNARLAGLSTMREIPIYKVKVDMDLTKLDLPAPEGFEKLNAGAVVQFQGDYPLDESIPMVRSQMYMIMEVDGKGRPDAKGPELQLTGVIRHSVTNEFVYKR